MSEEASSYICPWLFPVIRWGKTHWECPSLAPSHNCCTAIFVCFLRAAWFGGTFSINLPYTSKRCILLYIRTVYLSRAYNDLFWRVMVLCYYQQRLQNAASVSWYIYINQVSHAVCQTGMFCWNNFISTWMSWYVPDLTSNSNTKDVHNSSTLMFETM